MTAKEAMAERSIAGTWGGPVSLPLASGVLRAVDLAIIGLSGLAVYAVYLVPIGDIDTSRYFSAILIGMIVAGLLLERSGLYSEPRVLSKRPQFARVLSAWAVTFAFLLASAFALKISASYSRAWAIGWFLSATGLLACSQIVWTYLVARWIRQGKLFMRTVIVGAGEQGQRLAASIEQRGEARSLILGFIDDRKSRIPTQIHGHPLLGGFDQLMQLIRHDKVDQVLIALPWSADQRIAELIHQLSTTPVHIRLAPDLAGLARSGGKFIEMDGLLMLRLLDRPISGWSHVWKSLEDKSLAALLLLLLSPAMLLIALAVKLDSRGPLLFKQKRYGFNDQLFEIWKFRTMYEHCADPAAEVLTTKDDPRVTRVGRFLRKSSLDELPQLLNVLRGDMSLVGPRPHALAAKAEGRLYQEVVDRYAARHRVKPGITGWAQVNGWRGETDTVDKIRRRVECDLHYIDNWSVAVDLIILAKTLYALLKHRNAV